MVMVAGLPESSWLAEPTSDDILIATRCVVARSSRSMACVFRLPSSIFSIATKILASCSSASMVDGGDDGIGTWL